MPPKPKKSTRPKKPLVCTMPTARDTRLGLELGDCGAFASRIRPPALGGEPVCEDCWARVERDLSTAARDAERQYLRWLRCKRM